VEEEREEEGGEGQETMLHITQWEEKVMVQCKVGCMYIEHVYVCRVYVSLYVYVQTYMYISIQCKVDCMYRKLCL